MCTDWCAVCTPITTVHFSSVFQQMMRHGCKARIVTVGVQDIFLNFRTAYFDKRGVIVISQKMIARNYLKSWFVIDFITCLPISYIMMVS